MIADIDGLTEDDNGNPAIIEIKCVSEYKRSEWDNDQIPQYYLTQVMHYLAVTGLDTAYVCALIGGNSMIIREVHADEEMIAMLIACEKDFWQKVTGLIYHHDIMNPVNLYKHLNHLLLVLSFQ